MEPEKKYELRVLQSKDIFTMSKIIRKIGVNEFVSCFESDEVKEVIAGIKDEKADDSIRAVGMYVMLDIATVIINHIPDVETEVYTMLSNLSGMNKDEIENLDIATFVEMIIDVFKKDEFKDFIVVVSKLLK